MDGWMDGVVYDKWKVKKREGWLRGEGGGIWHLGFGVWR